MSSKPIFFSFALALSLAISSCSVKFGDLPTPQNARITSGGCLTNISETVDAYLNGKAQAETLRQTTSCLVEALEEFDFVNKGEGFKPNELVIFLNRKVFGEPRISRNLTTELMKIKVLFVGGRSDYVLNKDFKKLISFVRFIEEQALLNLPHIRIYRNQLSASEVNQLTLEQLKEAKVQMRRTAYALAAWIRGSQVTYDFESLEQLIREFRALLNFVRPSSEDQIAEWVNLIRIYKQITVSGSSSEIEPRFWVSILGGMAELYGLRMDASYFLQRKALYISEGFAALNQSAEKAFGILEAAIRNQKSGNLSYALVGELFRSLTSLDLLPSKINAEQSLLPLIKKIGSVVFRTPGQTYGQLVDARGQVRSQGITIQNLQQMRAEFGNWSAAQTSILQVKTFAEARGLKGDFKSIALLAKQDGISIHPSVNYLLDAVGLQFQAENKSQRVAMVSLAKSFQNRDYQSLSYANIARAVSRLLIRWSVQDSERFNQLRGVTADEAEVVFRDILPLGADLGLFERDKLGLGENLFKEGNLFTFSGNGVHIDPANRPHSLLTSVEIVEQLALIYSGHQVQAGISRILELLPNGHRCRVNEAYRLQCAKVLVHSQWESLIWNFPKLKQVLKNSSPQVRSQFFETIWQMTISRCTERDIAKKGDLVKFATILHFIEAVFVTYDLNEDDILSGPEVMRAFPRFQVVLDQEVQKRENEQKSVGILKGVFAFLVSRGRLPSGISDKSKIAWWDVWYFDSDPEQFIRNPRSDVLEMSITRPQLAEVFQFLHSSASTCQ